MSSPLEKQYPLHLTVYVQDIDKLRKILDEDHEVDLEAVDARGRSANSDILWKGNMWLGHC